MADNANATTAQADPNADPQNTNPGAGGGEPTAPEKYELKLAENSGVDASLVDKISNYAKEKGLTNEAAQELLNREVTLLTEDRQAQRDTSMEEVKAVRESWVKARKEDPEIGGDKAQESATYAQRIIEKYGTPELKRIFEDSGFGDHPEVVRIFARLGKAAAEDKMVFHKGMGGEDEKPMQDVFYGETSPSR